MTSEATMSDRPYGNHAYITVADEPRAVFLPHHVDEHEGFRIRKNGLPRGDCSLLNECPIGVV